MAEQKKYHIGKNGPALCKATVRKCRYGDQNDGSHYSSIEEARAVYEKKLEDTNETVTRKQKYPEEVTKLVDKAKNIMGEISSFDKTVAGEIVLSRTITLGEIISEISVKLGAPSDIEIEQKVAENLAQQEKEIERLSAEKAGQREKLVEFIKQLRDEGYMESYTMLPETPQNLKDKYNKLKEAHYISMTNYIKSSQYHEFNPLPANTELFKLRNKKLREALQLVGVKFAEPGDIKVSDKSRAAAKKILGNAVTFYPKSWVEMSNNDTSFVVKISKRRAHYASMAKHKTRRMIDDVSVYAYDEGNEPDPMNMSTLGAFKMEGDEHVIDLGDGSTYTYSTTAKNGQTCWVIPKMKIAKTWEGEYVGEKKPSGPGWKQYEVYDGYYDTEKRKWVEKGTKKIWAKPIKKKYITEVSYEPELTININQEHSGLPKGTSIALHEFAHRMEQCHPQIRDMEHGFLALRAGDNPKLEQINGMKGEYGYRDNFTNHYMGKIYLSGSAEILSMGMETLFGGQNGGFTGAYNNKPDPEYKNLILGMLATPTDKTNS